VKVPLDEQILAMELCLLSQRGHVDNLRRLVSKREREPFHLEEAEAKLPQYRAILETLKWLKKNEEKIRRSIA
jgi:hypothetical protein